MRVAWVRMNDVETLQALIPGELAVSVGNPCMVERQGVMEYGVIERVDEPAEGQGGLPEGSGQVVRRATLQDQSREKETLLRGKMAFDRCEAYVRENKLEMHLIRVNYSFDRAVLRILFASEERVDFRQMIKDLSVELKTRVEIKQVGVRDQAGIIGGVADCGRALCCCRWLKQFAPVNVRMAKQQNLSLNPTTISGMCGRLKCCLRYEQETYRALADQLPREGSRVHTPEGDGRVVDRDVLCQRVKVLLDDQRRVECDAGCLHRV